MAKFAIRCPHCDTVNKAPKFTFGKNIISCGSCGREIDVKQTRITSRICPHCHENFVFDQGKGKTVKCPSCGKTVDAFHAHKYVDVNCPQCACSVEVEENEVVHPCPVCGYTIDVFKERAKAKLVNSNEVSVIQYEGPNDVFVWKHPIEDFNTGSQLIVHESQEAIFIMNGQALDTFGPGRYSLETENLPVLKRVFNLPTGAQTPFHCEVYFINKTVRMGMKWGTDSRVRFIDPATGIPLDIGASGELNIQVVDSRKLLIKLVGTTGGLTDRNVLSCIGDSAVSVHRTLQSYFRAPLMTEVKSYLAATIKAQHLDIMEIDQHMGQLSEALRERIAPKFEEYGLTIPNFYITFLSLPEDDPNFQQLRQMRAKSYIGVKQIEIDTTIAEAEQKKKIIEAQTAAQLTAIKAQGEAEAVRAKGIAEADVMRAQGYTQKDVLEADVQKAYAAGFGQMGANAGGGGGGTSMFSELMTAAAGMKMAGTMFEKMDFGMGVSQKTAEAVPAEAPAASGWTCECGHSGNQGKFCAECGKAKAEAWDCACGHKGNKGKFCEECGSPKPVNWDRSCGQKGNTGKCCPECGARRP